MRRPAHLCLPDLLLSQHLHCVAGARLLGHNQGGHSEAAVRGRQAASKDATRLNAPAATRTAVAASKTAAYNSVGQGSNHSSTKASMRPPVLVLPVQQRGSSVLVGVLCVQCLPPTAQGEREAEWGMLLKRLVSVAQPARPHVCKHRAHNAPIPAGGAGCLADKTDMHNTPCMPVRLCPLAGNSPPCIISRIVQEVVHECHADMHIPQIQPLAQQLGPSSSSGSSLSNTRQSNRCNCTAAI